MYDGDGGFNNKKPHLNMDRLSPLKLIDRFLFKACEHFSSVTSHFNRAFKRFVGCYA